MAVMVVRVILVAVVGKPTNLLRGLVLAESAAQLSQQSISLCTSSLASAVAEWLECLIFLQSQTPILNVGGSIPHANLGCLPLCINNLVSSKAGSYRSMPTLCGRLNIPESLKVQAKEDVHWQFLIDGGVSFISWILMSRMWIAMLPYIIGNVHLLNQKLENLKRWPIDPALQVANFKTPATLVKLR